MKKSIIKIICIFNIIILFITMFNYKVFAQTKYNQVEIPATQIRNNGINNFPESYKKLLQKLVNKTGHTNWKFVPLYTDIDWNELVEEESEHLKNTIIKNEVNNYPSSWYCSCGKEGDAGYYCASKDIISYYLDPRNFLTEITIFQFLDLSNNISVSVSDIEKLVDGTFLDGEANGIRYAKMIYDASKESGESAYSLVIKIFQELGKNSQGNMPYVVSGLDEKYPNVYNFFNYGAKDGDNNIELALEYAYNAGWTTPYKAIVEGAKLLSNNYLNQGQNTKYTYKFDIIGNTLDELYEHQYMTNVQDPNNQANMLYEAYSNNGFLNRDLTFIIPVYKNMPTYVKLPSNQTGNLYYVSSNYTSVFLRNGPGGAGSGYINIAALLKDTVVSVIQTGIKGWAKVKYNDLEGYMSEDYLTPVNTVKDTYKIPTISELPFIDVDADAWYYNSVKYCYDNNIIMGTTNETFSPNTNVTRGNLVTILWRIEGSPRLSGSLSFPDVKETDYYYEAVKWAQKSGVVHGYDTGKFGPNNNISREQLATILNNYAKYKKKDTKAQADLTKFTDNKKISSYAREAVSWAVAKKVMSGKVNGTIVDPQGRATRAEAAAMIQNYCSYIGR